MSTREKQNSNQGTCTKTSARLPLQPCGAYKHSQASPPPPRSRAAYRWRASVRLALKSPSLIEATEALGAFDVEHGALVLQATGLAIALNDALGSLASARDANATLRGAHDAANDYIGGRGRMGRCDEQEPRRLVALCSSMPTRLGAFSDNAQWQLGEAAWYGRRARGTPRRYVRFGVCY